MTCVANLYIYRGKERESTSTYCFLFDLPRRGPLLSYRGETSSELPRSVEELWSQNLVIKMGPR